MCVPLGACVLQRYSIRNVPIGTLRADVLRVCCATACIQVYVVLRRPANSVVNPFRISQAALSHSANQDPAPDVAVPSTVLSCAMWCYSLRDPKENAEFNDGTEAFEV